MVGLCWIYALLNSPFLGLQLVSFGEVLQLVAHLQVEFPHYLRQQHPCYIRSPNLPEICPLTACESLYLWFFSSWKEQQRVVNKWQEQQKRKHEVRKYFPIKLIKKLRVKSILIWHGWYVEFTKRASSPSYQNFWLDENIPSSYMYGLKTVKTKNIENIRKNI